jgi:predicted metal-dependent hydrolase
MVQQKIYTDPQLGNVIFRKRKGIRRMSIRVHPSKGVSVSLPYLVPYSAAQAFFKLKREWIIRTVARQQERHKNVQKADPQQVDAMRRQAKAELPPRLAELAARYGFTYNRVTIKHNATNWGSCSTRNNINLNLNIVRLPAPLRDYILLHELCHLRHHDHGQAFHLLLEHVCTDNLLKLCEESEDARRIASTAALSPADVQFARDLARAAAVSKARYPIDHVCTKAIKQYPLI